MATKRLVNVTDAAHYAEVTPSTIWRWLHNGLITRYRIGPKFVRVDLNELDALTVAEKAIQ